MFNFTGENLTKNNRRTAVFDRFVQHGKSIEFLRISLIFKFVAKSNSPISSLLFKKSKSFFNEKLLNFNEKHFIYFSLSLSVRTILLLDNSPFSNFPNCSFISPLLLLFLVLTLSYNQPRFCLNTTWNSSATTFADQSFQGTQPHGIFVNSNNSIYIPNRQTDQIHMWQNDNHLNPLPPDVHRCGHQQKRCHYSSNDMI